MNPPSEPCPVCFGCGQITGPRSMAFRSDPTDPFNATVRLCDECEGTSVVTSIRAAAIRSRAMDRALTAIDQTLPELAAAAKRQVEHDMRARGFDAL